MTSRTDSNIASRFDEIYDSTNKAALVLITAKCGNTADINDIFQDTYTELYKLLLKHGAGYVTNEKALVLKIARRKIAGHYSLMKKLQGLVSAPFYNRDELENIDFFDSFADEFSTEDFAVSRLLLEDAKKFIKSKPEDVKKIFYMFYDIGLTIPEIAAELSIKESNVKNKLYRTLNELKEMFGKEEYK